MTSSAERIFDRCEVVDECFIWQGHEFSGNNLIIRKSGARSCRICMRKYWNKFDALNRKERRVRALERYYAQKGG